MQSSINQRRFSTTTHPRHAYQFPQRKIDIHIFKIISGTSFQGNLLSIPCTTFRRDSDYLLPFQVLCRQTITFQNIGIPPDSRDLPSFSSRLGSQVHDIIGILHHLLVMLHHDHRVTVIPQFLQRMNQLPVILLVQPNTRFIQYIKDVYQL